LLAAENKLARVRQDAMCYKWHMNIIYLVFGDELSNHLQANFSILSMLTQEKVINSINVVTDQPNFYNHLADYIKTFEIDHKTLVEWKGPYDFFWRVKIKAVELLTRTYKNENLLYLDSDTFLFGNLNQIKDKLNEGFSFMHLSEGKLAQLGSKEEKRLWRQTCDKSFGPVKITETHCMWNAGVIGIPGSKSAELIKATLDICDAMLEQKVTRRLIEQFSFSLALSEFSNLIPADQQIGHYWGNKRQWNNFITNFFLTSYLSNTPLHKQIDFMKSVDYTKFPVIVRIASIRYDLQDLLAKIFPARGKKYIKPNSE